MNKRQIGTLTKEDVQIANNYIKMCSVSLIDKEMQNITMIRNYQLSTGLAKMRRIHTTNYWKEGGATSTLRRCRWEC